MWVLRSALAADCARPTFCRKTLLRLGGARPIPRTFIHPVIMWPMKGWRAKVLEPTQQGDGITLSFSHQADQLSNTGATSDRHTLIRAQLLLAQIYLPL